MNDKIRFALAAIAVVFTTIPTADAGVILGGTRVIYPERAREVALRLDNKGERPALIQAWIDDGDASSTPERATAPFLITPAVFRMEANRQHTLRILHNGEAGPSDRESVYWLNVLEIPPKPTDAEGKNVLQFAFRNRIKLFHRPEGLAQAPAEAPNALLWRSSGAKQVTVENPSPYYVSFAALEISNDGGANPRADNGPGMVAPMSKETFAFRDEIASDATVKFSTVNDYGARNEFESKLLP